MTLWLVRAGKYGEREEIAQQNNLAIIGWDRIPDLTNFKTRESLADGLTRQYPEEQKKDAYQLGKSVMAFC